MKSTLHPALSKVFASAEDALYDVRDGSSVLFGGMGGPWHGPATLIAALRDRGSKDLTIIANHLGSLPCASLDLAKNRQVSKLIACFGAIGGGRNVVAEQIERGEIAFELVPMGVLCERLKAGASGIPAFYSSTGLGTMIEQGKEKRVFDGKDFLLETALTTDFVFINAHRADTLGNVVYRGTNRNFSPLFAMAGKVTIVEVEEIVQAGELDPDHIHTPGIYVDRIVKSTTDRRGLAMQYRHHSPLSVRLAQNFGPERLGKHGLSKELIAMRIANELAPGQWVNLGMGHPAFVSQFIPETVHLHTEVGCLDYGPPASSEEEIDVDYWGASGEFVTLKKGSSFCSTLDAFAMAKGGRLDAVVLGAYQVSEQGDFASTFIPATGAPGIGGAMDLIAGNSKLIIAMEHTTKDGEPKLVKECTLPLTAQRRVNIVVTDLAVVEITSEGLLLREVAPGWTADEVQSYTGATLNIADNLKEIEI